MGNFFVLIASFPLPEGWSTATGAVQDAMYDLMLPISQVGDRTKVTVKASGYNPLGIDSRGRSRYKAEVSGYTHLDGCVFEEALRNKGVVVLDLVVED